MTQGLVGNPFPVQPAYLTWTDATGPQQLLFDLVKAEDYDLGANVTEHPVEVGANVTDNVRVRLAKATLTLFATNEPIDSNNWVDPVQGTSVITIPSPTVPPDTSAAVIEYNAWDNMITERALLTGAAGLVGGLASPVASALGAASAGILGSLLLGGRPDPQVVITTAGNPPSLPLPPVTANVATFPVGQDFVAKMISKLQTLKDSAQAVDIIAPRLALFNMVIEALSIHRDADTGTGAEITLGLTELRIVSTTNVPAPKPTVPRAKPPVNHGEQALAPAPPKASMLFSLSHPGNPPP